MIRFSHLLPLPLFSGAGVASLVAVVVACSSRDTAHAGTDTASVASAVASPASAGTTVAGSSNTSANASANGPVDSMTADHEFLRKMSDHHKGLILVVHQALDRKDVPAIMADARKLDAEQDADLDTMTVTLRQKYNDAYNPRIMAEHQAMADSLKSLKGTAYEHAFLGDVIKHHGEGIVMMDQYLPKLSDPKIKAMAERMRSAQTAEVATMKRQMSSL